MASSLGISQIGQIFVTARDLERAVAFYRDTLGLRFLFQAPPKMAFFDCGGVRLMLGEPEAPEPGHPSSILYFKVGDIHGAWASLRDASAELMREPHLVARMPDHELWIAFFKDSEANTMALMSEVRIP